MIIGEGNHRYEVNHAWARLPASKKFGYTHGVVEDRAGRIYIANQGTDGIMIFQPDGSFVDAWGAEYREGAHGLTHSIEDGTEYLYLANTGLKHVVKTTLGGQVVWQIAAPPRDDIYDGAERVFQPTETSVGPNGIVYVADGYGQPWVHRYTLAGEYIDSFGGQGAGQGEMDSPHGITIDSRGGAPVVLVANRGNRRFDEFTLEGKFIRTTVDTNVVRFPCTAVTWRDELYIPDLSSRLTILDANNKLIQHMGDYLLDLPDFAEIDDTTTLPNVYADLKDWPNVPSEKILEGKFTAPHGLHVDGVGNIYVAEWHIEGRVTKLTRV